MNINATTKAQDDEAHHNVIPTPPSPARSSPSLTHSTSISSQTSIPQPHTPPRGRHASRYPANLGGRVPLHRRGTSRTYETLEDLLREAGYKETRIFTPEKGRDTENDGESANAEKSDSKRSSVRDSVGAVVGFLAGFMPGTSSRENSSQRSAPSQEGEPRTSDERPSQPVDPPLQVRAERVPSRLSDVHTTTSQSNRRSKRRTAVGSSTPGSTFTTNSTSKNNPLLQPPPPHLRSSTPSSASTATHPRRPPMPYSSSAASLRTVLNKRPQLHHMVSTPSVRQHTDKSLPNASDAETDAPPLPRTWLESVAHAVLFGGPGAHVGGPDTVTPKRATQITSHLARRHARPGLARTGSKLSRASTSGYLSDFALGSRSSLTTASLFPPPSLCVRMQTARAETTSVCRTAVVCRSAPASRSGSRVRNSATEIGGLWGTMRVGLGYDAGSREKGVRQSKPQHQRGRERGRGRSRGDGVPSLSRTRAEGDIWSRTSGITGGSAIRDGENEGNDEDEDGGYDSHSSSEGELDLAHMLVPPKRQHSIRSLRRHLHQHHSLGRRGFNTNRDAASSMWSDREDEDWPSRHRKTGRRASAFEAEDGYPIVGPWNAGEGSGAFGRRRRGIPNVWTQWTGVGT